MTIGEIIKRQARLRNRVSICNAVIKHLNETFISTRGNEAESRIVNDDGSPVLEEDVKDFCQILSDTLLAPNRVELEKLSEMGIVTEPIARLHENPDLIPMAALKAKAKKKAASK